MRITWPNATSVELYFTGKGAAKSQVHVQHCKLANQAAAKDMKAYWADRLAVLEEVLAPAARRTA